MARDIYSNTIALAQADGTLKALAGVQVFVYLPGTSTSATIYTGRTGAAQASNPLLTDATGTVEFYADFGEYDVKFHDTNLPARIADKTVQWNAVNASDQGIPTSKLTRDAGLDLNTIAQDVLRQVLPIGTVIEWWRPAATVPIPSGFAVCDGSTIAANAHDFGTGQPITVPDLRNQFIIGADPYKGDGSPSSNGNGTAAPGAQHPNAPGIGGGGGSNTSKDFSHTHTIPGHRHGVTDPGHGHSVSDPGHSHGAWTRQIGSGGGGNTVFQMRGDAAGVWADSSHGGTADGLVGIYNGGTGIGIASGTTGISVGPAGGTLGDNAMTTTGTNLSTTTDVRPLHVGLLRLMKVKRS